MHKMDYRQYRRARRLVHSCCNYDCGNCLLLDDGEGCVCVQSISYVQRAISIEKLAQQGYKSILELYERALMRLNRCIPNGTYSGVRGRLLK